MFSFRRIFISLFSSYFCIFFLGEYANILLMSSLFVIFFLGGGLNNCIKSNYIWFSNNFIFYTLKQEFLFSLKIILLTFFFIFIRANLPRFRFDQLMFIGWKIFLPLTLSFILFYSGFLFSINSLNLIQIPQINSFYNYIHTFSIRY